MKNKIDIHGEKNQKYKFNFFKIRKSKKWIRFFEKFNKIKQSEAYFQ